MEQRTHGSLHHGGRLRDRLPACIDGRAETHRDAGTALQGEFQHLVQFECANHRDRYDRYIVLVRKLRRQGGELPHPTVDA